jgi:hypothetical protein
MSSVRTPIGVLSFPHLFVAKPATLGGDPRFSLNLIFDQAAQKTPEYQELRKLVVDAIEDEWGQGKARDAEWMKKMKLRLPFRKCSERDYTGYDVEGGVFIAPWSKNQPGVIDASQQDMVASDVWAGQLARCSVHAFTYEHSGNKGVSFNLNNVQIVKAKMPRLDGRKAAREEFDKIDGAADPEAGGGGDPFAADEPPF